MVSALNVSLITVLFIDYNGFCVAGSSYVLSIKLKQWTLMTGNHNVYSLSFASC